jgi:hypothetical protein
MTLTCRTQEHDDDINVSPHRVVRTIPPASARNDSSHYHQGSKTSHHDHQILTTTGINSQSSD